MNVIETGLPGVLIVEPRQFTDDRGSFFESYRAEVYDRLTGVSFVQDNVSVSRRGVLRGLHLQEPNAQAKLVSALVGEVFDVAADVRVGSPTFGKWVGVTLSEQNRRQLFIPAGFAHGFLTMSETAVFQYKCSTYYDGAADLSIAWDDPQLGIDWPERDVSLSPKDRAAGRIDQLPEGRLPRYRGA